MIIRDKDQEVHENIAQHVQDQGKIIHEVEDSLHVLELYEKMLDIN